MAGINQLFDGEAAVPPSPDALELHRLDQTDVHGITNVATMLADIAAKQPLDSDLTAIAALATTATGRSLLAAVDAAAIRAITGSGPDESGLRHLLADGTGALPGSRGAATLSLLGQGGAAMPADNAGDTVVPIVIPWTASQWALPGKTTKLRIRGYVSVNATAPGAGTFTIGLHSVSAVAGASGFVSTDVGIAAAGTTGQVNGGTNLAASTAYVYDSGVLTPPADANYCIGVVNSGAIAAASRINFSLRASVSYT